MSRNKEHRGAAFGAAPNGRPPKAAAPLGLCSSFLLIQFSIMNICGYSLYIPKFVPCIFPCVFLNLWSQE